MLTKNKQLAALAVISSDYEEQAKNFRLAAAVTKGRTRIAMRQAAQGAERKRAAVDEIADLIGTDVYSVA